MNATPTFSPAEVQADRIENELKWIQSIVSGQLDPREYRLAKSMFIGDGAADVFETVCALWTGGVSPVDARFRRTLRFAATRAKMRAESIEFILEPGPFAHTDYLADKIREADRDDKTVRIASEITSRKQRGDDVSELVAELEQMQQPERAGAVNLFSFSRLSIEHEQLHEIVIDGYLRRGETANLIAPPKRGKSWLVLGLAFAVAQGRKWLGNHCRQGRVLIVDAELHPATLAHRMRMVAESVEADTETPIDVLSLRGQNCDLAALAMHLERFKPGTYELLVLDALYRFLPQGTSENDNAAMMAVYNQIDQIAKRLECAVVIIHHTSKGSQADKAVTDVGSGAGSISRAADTHITIRDHNEPDYQVLEAVTRSFQSPDPKTVYFNFPLWHESDLEPQAKGGRVPQSKINDQETRERILKLLKQASGSITFTKIRERTGFGFQRIQRGVAMLEESGEAKRTKVKAKRGGKPSFAVRLAKVPSSV